MSPIAESNRLGDSLSPYLRQHAGNPVNWQPWDDEALGLARESDAPILLSIGYAACHWCHVMERESFSDGAVAESMNSSFVCVKVDREERPDLDKTYQLAHYLLSRSTGGWPLTVFLTPEQVPFFSGTYFPPEPRGGMMSFPVLLSRVRTAWDERRGEIGEQNGRILEALRAIDSQATGGSVPGPDAARRCASQLASSFDLDGGGLGKAPKFPQVPSLRFSLAALARGEEALRPGLERTLSAMASGGLHDHVGGGFFRYCVDPLWDIPHFEKMLSDNAQLLELYAGSAVSLGNKAHRRVAQRTAEWMLGEMRAEGGGFLTAVDADSEREEGKFYVWTPEGIEAAAGKEGLDALRSAYNVDAGPNFEGRSLHVHQGIGSAYAPPGGAESAALAAMLSARRERVAPSVDDKVLASNCGLAAHALARAGAMLGERSWVDAARDSVAFVDRNMVVDGVMRTAWRDGVCSDVPAFLDDHALMLRARIELLADGCAEEDLNSALDAADLMLDLFDDEEGGLLFNARGAPSTIRDIRSCDDGPAPSGNGVAASCLLALGWIAGRPDHLERAEAIVAGFGEQLSQAPAHAPTMALALDDIHRTPAVVTVAGEAEEVRRWSGALAAGRVAGTMVLTQPAGDSAASELAKPVPEVSKVQATVCRGSVCMAPTDSLEAVKAELARNAEGKG